MRFLDPDTNATLTSATITKVEQTGHKDANGAAELMISVDRDVQVLPGQFIDCSDFKMDLGAIVDSYFHDGDNAGIQLKGARHMLATNNYATRIIAPAIFACSDYESGINDHITITNNTLNQVSYSLPDQYYHFPAISVCAQSLHGTGTRGIVSATVANNLITNSPYGISTSSVEKLSVTNNTFTASPLGPMQGWLKQ